MVTGKVKFYNVKKTFGFIAGDDGKDYFVHKTGLTEGTRLYEGDLVEFTAEEGERGPKAVNVVKTKSGGGEERFAQQPKAPAEDEDGEFEEDNDSEEE
jgi:CspA family cold shock protein